MKPKPLYNYITFGGELSFLRSVQQGTEVHGHNFILEVISDVLNFIESSDFKVTKKASIILEDFKKSLEKTPEDYKLNSQEQKKLFETMNKLMFVIQAESLTKFAYFLVEKRIENEKLLEAATLFAQDVFNSLPGSIQYDFSESGKCIAFECSTAGAFHSLRGLEGLLRLLLQKLSPQTNTSNMVWGALIQDLRSLTISELIVLLDNCDRIRDNYRNPTDHPEKIYDIEEVQDLFFLRVGVVNDIVAYMKRNNLL